MKGQTLWMLSHNLRILLCVLIVLLNLPKPQCPQLHILPPSLMACLSGWCSSGANPWDLRSLWPKSQSIITSFSPKPYLSFGSVNVGGYLTCTSHPALEWLYCTLLTAWHSAADPEALANAVFVGPSWQLGPLLLACHQRAVLGLFNWPSSKSGPGVQSENNRTNYVFSRSYFFLIKQGSVYNEPNTVPVKVRKCLALEKKTRNFTI